ncbi:uncharacterized protein B0H64DRAFT_77390 [Chaetomium fimeti]|uniref:RGS domain-containing protein n=1 Tax=Chaetomium fimeti TaxID=1854472 RepID=A0AAE0HL34_9PEZI|nr:hypothetical protein B0H64DRAFT_77390 [Chaetomium fimeti]
MGLLPLTYRRPAYVEKPESTSYQASLHDDRASSASLQPDKFDISSGIPPALGFDKILEGGTCPPCTIRDFMNYLLYVERSAENLQFFLWYRDYERRFAAAKTADLSLAPEWTQAMEDEAILRIKKEQAGKARQTPKGAATIFKGTDFEKGIESEPTTPTDNSRSLASQAFASAGVKDPFTIQPFRKELDRVIATYIMDGAPRQLNLSELEQKAALQALARTTHPSAFALVARQTEATLRLQAHPNFIRWSICNGNPARVCFAWGLGVGAALIGVVLAVVLTLSGAGRGYRALAAIAWVAGFATLMGAYKGMCIVLHGFHHRHIRPWELFVSDLDDDEDAISAAKRSFDSFGSANSYEDEPWVVRYRRRNIARKIFDREVWVEEPALRQIQDVIFVQSIVFGFVCAAVLTVVFVAVPGGGFF